MVVGTKEMRSKPALFANEVDIPVPVPTVQQVTKPVITMLSSDNLSCSFITALLNSFLKIAKPPPFIPS